MALIKRELVSYETVNGKIPFDEWIKNLKDRKGRSIIAARLDRFEETGHPGPCESVGDGIYEMKIYFGPGYRVYFAQENTIIVLLLCGGDKSTQNKDIRKARDYWADHRRRK